jgi:hypothetical protein
VFSKLRSLKSGDMVMITGHDGTTRGFRVSGARSFPKDHFPTTEIYSETQAPVLRMITCAGRFDRGSGHDTDNLVVSAVPA